MPFSSSLPRLFLGDIGEVICDLSSRFRASPFAFRTFLHKCTIAAMAWLPGGEDFMQQINNLFNSKNSPKRSRAETANGAISNPFGPEESSWLEASLGATMHTFGSHVDKRFRVAENEIKASRERILKLEEDMKTNWKVLLEKMVHRRMKSSLKN